MEWRKIHYWAGTTKVFAPKVESKENTDQFSKDETLIEEKSILTQELILGGHEMPCEVNLEKK